MAKCTEFGQRLPQGEAADYNNELRTGAPNTRWQDLLKRQASATELLASNSFAFRGYGETLPLNSPQDTANFGETFIEI
jgi:hypothetical protein